jgi:hypothetical protein
MASRSRFVQYLAIAALPIVALLSGCATGGQKAFRYAGQLQRKAARVEISSDCTAHPDGAVITLRLINLWNPDAQVLWRVNGKRENDRVVISDGGAQLMISDQQVKSQAPNDKRQGRAIPSPFQPVYDIPASDDAIPSGVPKAALKFLQNPGDSVVWKYTITYYRDGKQLCTLDPVVCIQKWGTTVCQEN